MAAQVPDLVVAWVAANQAVAAPLALSMERPVAIDRLEER
jgi:hypothetical protein